MAAAWRLRLELMLHLLEQAPLRCDQFAQVTDVIAGANRHQCEQGDAAVPPSLHPSIHRNALILAAGCRVQGQPFPCNETMQLFTALQET